MSLARRHRETILAAQAAGATLPSATGPAPMPSEGPVATEYQTLLAALGVHLNELRNIQSVERKIEAKRSMIGTYRAWVDGALAGALAAGQAPQDEIVANMLVWAIDLADWPLALDIARHVLAHGLSLPERYKRQPAVAIAEQVAEAGLGQDVTVDLKTLLRVETLTATHDMPDQVRAKLHKALALAFTAAADAFDPTAESAVAGGKRALLDNALTHFRRALGLDAGCGVKKLIEQTTRDLAKAAQAASGEPPA
ncbi:phage terminase small subunit [Novosphingobium sp.]|uniref:phage terminase small subunit n=1 Tax=Novosphingobium sp. TaxID=1874826 RepID=UPI0038BE1C0A